MKGGRRWKNKPPVGTTIDWEHPWTKGLSAFWIFNEGQGLPIELISMRGPSSSAAFSWNVGGIGQRGVFNGTTTNLTYSNIPAIGPAMSVAGSCTAVNTATNFMLIERSPVNTIWEVYCPGTSLLQWKGSNNTVRNSMSIAGLSNTRFSWGVTDNGTGTGAINGSTMYLNGAPQIAGGSPANAVPAISIGAVHLGNYDNTSYFFNGTQDYIVIWNYAISPQIMNIIGRNPNAIWQIFKPRFNPSLYGSKQNIIIPQPIPFTGLFSNRQGLILPPR